MSEFKTVKEAVEAAYAALAEAEQLALESGEGFGFHPTYGMGGYFDPEEENEYTGDNWFPSSLGC
jgi:hypothetical protein